MKYKGSDIPLTSRKKPNIITMEARARMTVAAMHGLIEPVDPNDRGGWIFDFDTQKYLDYNGDWVDEPIDDITIPNDLLHEAVNIIKDVYPNNRIIIVTP